MRILIVGSETSGTEAVRALLDRLPAMQYSSVRAEDPLGFAELCQDFSPEVILLVADVRNHAWETMKAKVMS